MSFSVQGMGIASQKSMEASRGQHEKQSIWKRVFKKSLEKIENAFEKEPGWAICWPLTMN